MIEMRLHHYLCLCFFLMPFILVQLKPMYSAAAYNPVDDEVVSHRDGPLPEHIQVHEEVHRLMRWEIYAMVIAIGLVILGLHVGTPKIKYGFLAYIMMSMHAEITAYWLTPVSLPYKALAIWVICGLGWINFRFWRYFFYVTDLKKNIMEATWKDIGYSPLAALVFWVI